VLVKPMPGGGGTLARNFLYEAKADGLTLNLTAHGPKILTSGLFKLQGVRYQWSKFTFIGKTVESNSCVIVGKTAAYKGPADLAGKKFNYGESSPFFGPLFAEALNWDKMTVIPGYRSTTGRAVAISRGELQAASASAQATVASPDLIRLLVCSFPSKGFPNVPRVAQGMAPGRKKWVDYIEGWNKAMYVTVAPPGVPADRARFLEKALERMWADPEYQKAIKKIRYNPSSQFISSAELKSFVESLVALKDDEVKDMRTVITKKYKKK
jgi:tripartite-type tricarboxylate transporter receptor subunit TctC